MSILESDTVAGIPVNGLYIPEGIGWRYDKKNQILLPSIDFQNLVSGEPGETIGIPESVIEGGFDSGFSVPQLQIPPLPILTIPPLLGGLITGTFSSSMVTSVVQTFQADYARRTDLVSESRGITIDSVSMSPTLSQIQMTVSKAGLYWCSAYFQQQASDATPGAYCDGDFQINLPGASIGFRNHFYSTVGSLGVAVLTGELSGLFTLVALDTVLFSLTSGDPAGGDWGAPGFYGLSLIRISA
jgi:hypothetical protein